MAPLTASIFPQADESVRIEVTGDLHMAWGHRLRDAVSASLGSFAPKLVVIDLVGITFLDSAGIGALVGALKEARERGSELVVRNPTPFVYHILKITGLTEAFGLPATSSPD